MCLGCVQTDATLLTNNSQHFLIFFICNDDIEIQKIQKHTKRPKKENKKKSKRKLLTSTYVIPREDKGDREGIPRTYPIPQVIRLELFLESG